MAGKAESPQVVQPALATPLHDGDDMVHFPEGLVGLAGAGAVLTRLRQVLLVRGRIARVKHAAPALGELFGGDPAEGTHTAVTIPDLSPRVGGEVAERILVATGCRAIQGLLVVGAHRAAAVLAVGVALARVMDALPARGPLGGHVSETRDPTRAAARPLG